MRKFILSLLYFFALLTAVYFLSGCSTVNTLIQDTCTVSDDICQMATAACNQAPDPLGTVCAAAANICNYVTGVCQLVNSGNYNDNQVQITLLKLESVKHEFLKLNETNKPLTNSFWSSTQDNCKQILQELKDSK